MYLREMEEGKRPRDQEEICQGAWDGIRAHIRTRINNGSFGVSFPATCEESNETTGCDEGDFWRALKAEIPSLQKYSQFDFPKDLPRTLDILYMIQFCWGCVGEPVQIRYHEFFQHHHLRFDIDTGRKKFRRDINRILQCNDLAYELTKEGHIKRLVDPVLYEAIESTEFRTGDVVLDGFLKKARSKFFEPDETTRREALEALWDAWERLKTLGSGRDKKAQTTSLLDGVAGSSSTKFRATLEREAKELSHIGNSLQIRHSEIDQEILSESEYVDYLFHRLFCFIQMILRINNKKNLIER